MVGYEGKIVFDPTKPDGRPGNCWIVLRFIVWGGTIGMSGGRGWELRMRIFWRELKKY
jgi:hypothetical protein